MNYQGKSIVIVGGGLLQVPAVDIARDLGLRVIITDRAPSCACASLADEFYALDTRDWRAHVELAPKLKNVVAVFTEGASVEVTVAKLARALGVPGLAPEIAERIANKAMMRVHLFETQPIKSMFYWAYQFERARFQMSAFGVPFVVKPVDSSASRGLTKCKTVDEFTLEVFQRASEASTDGSVLIEEWMQPDPRETIPELSCETVWQDGVGYWLSAVDRPFITSAHYAIESAVYAPAMHAPYKMQEIINLCLAAGRALGMTTGIFKCDVMLTDKGARILETTARLSGGFDSQYLTPLAYGADYIRGAMLLALGEPIRWEYFYPKWHRAAIARWLFLPQGKIVSIDTSEAEKMGRVFSRVKVGDTIPPTTTCADRHIVCIADGEDWHEADSRADEMASKINVGMERGE